MANFGTLTGAVKSRSEKFKKRLTSIINKAPNLAEPLRGTPDAVLKATGKFLAGFGSEVARLNKLSRERLARRDPIQQAQMRAQAIAKLQRSTEASIRRNMELYGQGKLPLAALRTRLQETLRRSALASAVIGVGGVGNLSENVLQAVQRQLTYQFERLDGFISEMSRRELTQKDRARALQYASSAHMISQTATRQFSLDTYGGAYELEERRFLGGAEHCDDCLALAAEGWVEVGTLPPIGQGTVCGNYCRCTLVTRPKDVDQAQPVQEGN